MVLAQENVFSNASIKLK